MARQTPLTCSGHTRPVVHLSFSDITPYGYFLISACKDGKPMLRQGDTGDWLGTFEGHKGAVWGATLNRNATQAATGAADFTVKVWDALSGDELLSFSHKHIVKSVDFSEDGHYLLTGSNEKLLRILDLQKSDADPEILKGHTSSIKAALWSDDNKYIFSGGDDKVIRIWERQSASEIKTIELGSAITGMDLTRDGQILIVTYGKTVSFWDTNTFENIKSYNLPAAVYSASLHPSKSSFVTGGEDFIIYKYDYNTGKEIESFKGHFGPVHCTRFSPDGELYASGSEDGTLRLWQNEVGKTYGLWQAIEDCNNSIDVTSAES